MQSFSERRTGSNRKKTVLQVYHQIFTKPVIIVVQNADLDLLFTQEKNLRKLIVSATGKNKSSTPLIFQNL